MFNRRNIIATTTIIVIAISFLVVSYPQQRYTSSEFHIEVYKSSVDQDQDGIDDQSDILQNAKQYISTKPRYKSKYYKNGYPDDRYGVCTDVVAQALLHSGYDLQILVDKHIQSHPDLYDINQPDNKIDFRRVKNLYVYFKDTAISLTTDIYKIDEWQPGDIVVFKKHIGIISDYRNKLGIPYLIHHYSQFQRSYEEDVLEKRTDIIGHYRIS